MIGQITKQTPHSAYQPSKEIREFTMAVRKDYDEGIRILQRSWVELNDRSVIEDQNAGQAMFNAYVDTSVEDPNEAWKWRGTRSMARNKAIAMHAQLTANYLLPLFVAQNDDDEVDRDFSQVMRDLIEWMAQPSNSNYQQSFLQVTFGMMYNPVTFLSAEFFEVMQTIKTRKEDGSISKKEILDEVLSGFKANLWSANQVLITNAYERNIQKQRAIIKRRYAEYSELEAIYGDHENWAFVTRGIKSIYNMDDDLFYDIKDDEHPNLVAEEIHLNRQEDSEVPFINGIYMGDSDVNANPIRHRDNRNTPKYNVVPFGYLRIGEHFFYYKSMMNALRWDEMAYDAMSEIVFNRAILEVEMPIAISGSDPIDSAIIFPNAVASFESKDTKITPLLPPSNFAAGFQALQATEKSMSEGSIPDTLAGQLPAASQKAFTVAQVQANARKLIGSVGKSLAQSIIMYGDLMKDIAINNITVPEVEELSGGRMKLKYKTFLLENKKSGKGVGDSVIKFDESLIGKMATDEEKIVLSLKLLDKAGDPNRDKRNKPIRLVNPELFAKYKYLTKVDVAEMFTKTDEFWQPVLLGLKQALANDPFINQEGLTRKIMTAFFQSEGEDLMKEDSQKIPGLPDQLPQAPPGQPPQGQPPGQQAPSPVGVPNGNQQVT